MRKLLIHDHQEEKSTGKSLMFFCPGCQHGHVVYVEGVEGVPNWTWNGSITAPTFTPSVLTWLPIYENGKEVRREQVCHSFVRDGKIQFLGDCDHALKNQTVDLPDFDEMGKEAASG